MRKLDTLKKALETTTDAELAAIINNNDVILTSLTKNERMFVLMFAELEKALRTKEHQLVLDCNYQDSKNSGLRVDYYRLAIAGSMIQIYAKSNCTFAICTSASKANREHFAQLENDLHFTTKYDSKTKRAKTTQRTGIPYAEVVDIIKQVIAVLESTATQKAEQTTAE